MSVVAFVPSCENDYTEWNIVVTNTEFIASTDTRYFHVERYTHDQFTEQMLKLWEHELR